MNVLVLNSGSSSLKYQLIKMPCESVLCSGVIERVGYADAIFTHCKKDKKHTQTVAISDHKMALEKIAHVLLDTHWGVLESKSQVAIVGHRVVHGGSVFSKPTIINKKVQQEIKALSSLAPLHNPANLQGIDIAQQIFQSAEQVAIFDTAFHQTIPRVAYQYALPNEYLDKHKIRVYGFHGTSHQYVSRKAIDFLKHKNAKYQNIISMHLGNGCSITAIKNGQSVETSMGFSPVSGLIMGTRVGDLDVSVLYYFKKYLHKTDAQIQDILQKESGMLGLTGFSDLREIEKNQTNNSLCKVALELSAYRIAKYIGAYTGVLEGVDALVFTGGIGENSSTMRQLICERVKYFGVVLDKEKNRQKNKTFRAVEHKNSKVKIMIIPTNEELEIAKQSYQFIVSLK